VLVVGYVCELYFPGGPRAAYDACEHIFSKCAAQVADGACITYIGPIGSGNYVKMIHNGRFDVQDYIYVLLILCAHQGLNMETCSSLLKCMTSCALWQL
jgi:6-phosphogluconate dehydrogenase